MRTIFKKALNLYSNIWPIRPSKPPHNHIVQLGDPILRTSCLNVPLEDIGSQKTLETVQTLIKTMRNYKCVGLAAPQLGLNQRIFVMELNNDHLKGINSIKVEKWKVELLPLTVCINPELKIISPIKVTHEEGCESIKGYEANVERYYEISLSAYDEKGKYFTNILKAWTARIAQHEVDHLDGKVYTDIMDKHSFCSSYWREVNRYRGKIETRFYP